MAYLDARAKTALCGFGLVIVSLPLGLIWAPLGAVAGLCGVAALIGGWFMPRG